MFVRHVGSDSKNTKGLKNFLLLNVMSFYCNHDFYQRSSYASPDTVKASDQLFVRLTVRHICYFVKTNKHVT